MHRKLVDGIWLTALVSACGLSFYPAQGAVSEPPVDHQALRRRPAPRRTGKIPQVSHNFVEADLVDVVKVLAEDMQRNAYIGPGVEGSVTARFDSVPADIVLAWVLQREGGDVRFKLIGINTLIVAGDGRVDQIEDEILGRAFGPRKPRGVIRQEILLENARAAAVIATLQARFENVEFIPHPTMNGFYAVGSRAEIVEIRNAIPELDQAP